MPIRARFASHLNYKNKSIVNRAATRKKKLNQQANYIPHALFLCWIEERGQRPGQKHTSSCTSAGLGDDKMIQFHIYILYYSNQSYRSYGK